MSWLFETPRLLVKPYGQEDWPFVHRIWSDPGVIWWRADDPMSEAETRDLHGRYSGLNGAAARGFGWWLVFERAGGAAPDGLLGQVALKPLPELPGEIEIGWQLLPAARGRGYATEAARRLLQHGFEDMGLEEIIAVIVPDNPASLGVAQRLAMAKTGELMKKDMLHHVFRIAGDGAQSR